MATSTLKHGIESVSVTWESGYTDAGTTKVFVKDGILYVNLAIYNPNGTLPTTLTKVATLSKGPNVNAGLSGVETNGGWVPTGGALAHIAHNGVVNLVTTGSSNGRVACVNGTAPI